MKCGIVMRWILLLMGFKPGTLFVCVEVLRPSQPNGVMLSTVSKWLTSIVHILLSETDNCPSWISGRERMTLENISWSISTKECCRPRQGFEPATAWSPVRCASNWATEASTWDLVIRDKNVLSWTMDYPCPDELNIMKESYSTQSSRYSERHHLFPKILPLKWICCCKEFLMSRMICNGCHVLFLFLHRTYVFGYLLELPQWGNSNKYPKNTMLEVLNNNVPV